MARMSWQEAKQLDDSLSSLEHFFPVPPVYAQTLTGGLTNRCWKVVAQDSRAYVWRPSTTITKSFSISRFQEYQILKAIEETGIGPQAQYICDQGLLVDWIEGESLRDSNDFDSLLTVLTHIHSLDTQRVPVAAFNFTARVDHYWMLIKGDKKVSPYKDIYEQWRSAPNLADVGHCLCHFDLAGYNMVSTPLGHRVIDWEYAAIADPRLDLALSIDIYGQSALEAVYRYCQLRELEGVDDWVEGVLAWQPRTTMMAMLWYLLAHQLWGDEDFLAQADKLAASFCS